MKTLKTLRKSTQLGFTLMELIVVIIIIVILASIIIPMVGKSVDDAKTAKCVELVRRLGEACGRYYMDTNAYPQEWTSSIAANAVASRSQLAVNDPAVPNWKGPYLDAALHNGDNPFGIGDVYLYNTIATPHLHSASPGGFDTSGDGTDDVVAATGGTVLCLWGGNQNPQAKNVDTAIDGDLAGGASWESRGKVEWGGPASGTPVPHLCILVFNQ